MIGIFDSGIGGLTVVKEVFKQLPQYQIIYFGDTARTPYGNKSKELITRYAFEDTDFLLAKGANLIIVACNTVSAVASDELKKKYKDIPIFEVITPAVNKAIKVTQNKKIGVIGTRATVNSRIYEDKINAIKNGFQIFGKACPLFVPLVEEGWAERPETKIIAKKYLFSLKSQQIDTLILGCTHYPLLRNLIQIKMGKRVSLVDPAEETVLSVKKFLDEHPTIEKTLQKDSHHKFYFSDISLNLKQIADSWLDQPIKPQLVSLS